MHFAARPRCLTSVARAPVGVAFSCVARDRHASRIAATRSRNDSEERTMPQVNIAAETTLLFDFGQHSPVEISNPGPDDIDVHIDYNIGTAASPQWSSALTGASGIANPTRLRAGASFVVARTDLESEHVRIGVHGNQNGARVSY
ncbi:hypothetical protein BDAG_04353 [Burkholderia dolosa AU0158]|nr:hypothetical protein BDAG_04353 [Burkholderia dolosa AU0158]